MGQFVAFDLFMLLVVIGVIVYLAKLRFTNEKYTPPDYRKGQDKPGAPGGDEKPR